MPKGQTLETALREATSFRKSEVAALAGQTLLFLGRGDVYFDAVGILNQPDQRAYWTDHFLALQEIVNQGGQRAAKLRDSIERMDSANGDAIMRLLTGYSQQQLSDGGDLELVEMLDSPSMAVRVLAIEIYAESRTRHTTTAPSRRMPYDVSRTSRNGWHGKARAKSVGPSERPRLTKVTLSR